MTNHPFITPKHFVCLLSVSSLLFLAGCQKSNDVAIKVGSMEVTKAEFDKAFESSRFPNEPEYRRIFIEQYVNQKLILLEAQRKGLDQDPEILNELQDFWQDRLLKTSMLDKFEEYKKITQATDAEVEQIYEETIGNKSLPDDPQLAKDKIRMMIAHEKQNKLLVDWLASLRKNTEVVINEQQLGLNK